MAAYSQVVKQCPSLVVQKERHDLSEQALVDKGMTNYINIDKDLISNRIKYGFLGKRSQGTFKHFQQRWFFLISSRPLTAADYVEDPRILDETLVPPLLELDTIYYYIMGKEGDTSGQCGEIKTIDILNVTVKDMSAKRELGHALIIDTGTDIFHLNTEHKFELEKWLEAILCSMQTARETKLSLTGQSRNIS